LSDYAPGPRAGHPIAGCGACGGAGPRLRAYAKAVKHQDGTAGGGRRRTGTRWRGRRL